MVQAVLGRVALQIGREQPPGFICGTARRYFPSKTMQAALMLSARPGCAPGDCPAAGTCPSWTRTYLDSLVVTSAESWFVASQSQASACAASPPSCSLMHLQDRAAEMWLQSPGTPRPQCRPHPSQHCSRAMAMNELAWQEKVIEWFLSCSKCQRGINNN